MKYIKDWIVCYKAYRIVRRLFPGFSRTHLIAIIRGVQKNNG